MTCKSPLPFIKQVIVLKYFLLLGCLVTVFSTATLKAEDYPDAGTVFSTGSALYEDGEFLQALPHLKQAAELAPTNSVYQHMLGKCYGRIAEHGSWLTALRYVNKTRQQFELAVKLDEANYPAWRDLEEFYRRAPSFFGGNKKRALEIRQMLEKKSDNPSPSPAFQTDGITSP